MTGNNKFMGVGASAALATCILTCGFSFPGGPAFAAPSAQELGKMLEGSGTLQKGYKCSVAIDGSIATVSSYQNIASKNLDNDCKIDAVLLAKKVFDYRPDVMRVKVKLFDPRGSGFCRNITLSVGDIASYSAGKTDMKSLLASMEIVNTKETAAAVLNRSTNGKSETNSTPDRLIQSANVRPELVFYLERKAGVRLAYPRGWQINEDPNPDHVFQAVSDNRELSMEFNVEPYVSEVSLERHLQFADDILSHHLKGYQKLESYPVRFGNRQTLRGMLEEFRLTKDGAAYRGSFCFFVQGDKLCTLRFYCPEAKLEQMRSVRADVMTNMAVAQAPSAGHSNTSISQPGTSQASASSNGERTYRSTKLSLSFRYPHDWISHPNPDKDTEVSVTGAIKKEQLPADLRLGVSEESEMSLDDFVQAVDGMLAKANKTMKTLDDRHQAMGHNNFVQATRQTHSCEMNGITVYFEHAFFKHAGRICCLSLSCPGWSRQEARDTFAKIVSTLEAR